MLADVMAKSEESVLLPNDDPMDRGKFPVSDSVRTVGLELLPRFVGGNV